MAKGPDHTDNVTKLDKPVLRLKTPAKRSAAAPSKTRSDHKKPRQDNADQANQTGAPPRGKSGASANKNRKSHKAKNAATKTVTASTLKSRGIVFDILTAVEDGTQLDKALAAHDGIAQLDGRDRRFVQLLATTYLRRRGQIEKILSPLMTRRPFGAQASANQCPGSRVRLVHNGTSIAHGWWGMALRVCMRVGVCVRMCVCACMDSVRAGGWVDGMD